MGGGAMEVAVGVVIFIIVILSTKVDLMHPS